MADTRKHYGTETIEQVIEYLAEDKTLEEISSLTGIGQASISRWRTKYQDQIGKLKDEIAEKKRKMFLKKVVDLGIENSALVQEAINEKLKNGEYESDKEACTIGAVDMMSRSTSYIGTMVDKHRLVNGETTQNVGLKIEDYLNKVDGDEF